MTVVDASVWVSSLMPQDLNYETSLRWLTERADASERIVVPSLFLPEVAGAVARRANSKRVGHVAVESILANPIVEIVSVDQSIATHAASLVADLGLRGADAVYVALAFQRGTPLVSWDRQQVDRASVLVDAHMPR